MEPDHVGGDGVAEGRKIGGGLEGHKGGGEQKRIQKRGLGEREQRLEFGGRDGLEESLETWDERGGCRG